MTATLDTLAGRTGTPAADLEFAGPVPAAVAQRLACDSGVAHIVFDGTSAVVEVGRKRRLPSASTRRALVARDGGCVWTGCDRAASWTSAHHIQHWAQGGATDLSNLVLLCYRHHLLVHEGGWKLARSPDGGISRIPPVPLRPLFPSARAPDEHSAA